MRADRPCVGVENTWPDGARNNSDAPFALCQELARSLEVAVAEGVRARGEDEQERTGGEEPNASLRPHTRPRAPARPHARPASRLACADAARHLAGAGRTAGAGRERRRLEAAPSRRPAMSSRNASDADRLGVQASSSCAHPASMSGTPNASRSSREGWVAGERGHVRAAAARSARPGTRTGRASRSRPSVPPSRTGSAARLNAPRTSRVSASRNASPTSIRNLNPARTSSLRDGRAYAPAAAGLVDVAPGQSLELAYAHPGRVESERR